MHRYSFVIFLSLFLSLALSSQEAGATFFTGISVGQSSDRYITENNSYHYGYTVGLDARITSGSLYFLVSGEYGKLDFRGVKENSLSSSEKVNLFKGRAGMGFKILGISEDIYFTSRLQGSFNLVTDYDPNNTWLKDNRINDGFMGVNTGLEFNFYALWAAIEYEKGIINMYYQRPESLIDFVSLKVGVKF